MSLQDLIAQRRDSTGAADPHPARQADEPAAPGNGGSGAEENAQQGAGPSEEPWGVARSVTPSGLEIYYQAGPKRLYRVRQENYDPGQWLEVPSVSTVLGVLEKGGLSWWGMKVGIAGVASLYRNGKAGDSLSEELEQENVDAIVDRLKAEKLTVNHVRDKAADRGTNVHSALESFVETGVMPDPQFFPENERGYVKGLVAFIQDANPVAFQSELMVASADGFAGRFDLFANLDFAGNVVTKTFPKRQHVRSTVGGTWLLDLKTSKGVYDTYHLQLAAYRAAMEECGYGAADHAGVVRLTDDGRYELVEGRASYEDFLAILGAYRALQGLKK